MTRTHCFARSVCSGTLVIGACACADSSEQPELPSTHETREAGQPPAPAETHPADGPSVVLAMNRLLLGDTNPDGTADPARAWRRYGYDLDRRAGDEKELCRRAGPPSPHPEGLDGIDNSFGRNLLPLLLGSSPYYSELVDEALAQGAATLMLRLDGLGPEPDYRPVPTRIFRAAAVAEPPAWDGSDIRPIAPESLMHPDRPESARVFFPGAYLVDDIWVSPPGATIELLLPVLETTLRLVIRDALITAEIDPDRQGAHNGVIAGVLDRDEMFVEAQRVIGTLDDSLCTGALSENLRALVHGAADIRLDRSRDPGSVCDGISIGVGFEARAVRLGGVAAPTPPEPDACRPDGP